MEYHDFKPTENSFFLNGKEYFLRPFDLTAQSWAYSHFSTKEQPDGFVVMATRIQDIRDVNCYLPIAWHLLKRKMDFMNYETFVKEVEKNRDDKWNNLTTIFKAVAKTITDSQPSLEEIKQEIELKKPSAAVG